MEKRKTVFFLISLCIIWAILIFVLCTMPQSGLPKFKIRHIDKIAHFGFFFVQSIFFSLLLHIRTTKTYLQIILLSALLAFVYGGTIEILQNNFFNRTGEIVDIIADVLGGFFGAMIYPAICKICRF
jgi:VanZ family protein